MEVNKKKIKIVLAMHGSPPLDFPGEEMAFFYGTHLHIEHDPNSVDDKTKKRAEAIEEKMKNWSRTAENDPYYTAGMKIGKNIEETTGIETFVGFNEFCNPTIQDALLEALKSNPDKIFVTTTMMTPGGEHQEKDIPEAINEITEKYPDKEIIYVWPYDITEVAKFIGDHIVKRIV
jgi:sirohydrochlorin cobaltochelatase